MSKNITPTATDQKSEDTFSSNTSNWADTKFWFAVSILIIYLIFLFIILYKAQSTNELNWTRMIYLFTGVEAIVFAAIGYVFGKDVHRQRAETAEKNAEKKAVEAENAKKQIERALEKAHKKETVALQLKAAIEAYNANNKNSSKKYSQHIKGAREEEAFNSLLTDFENDDYLVDFANKLFDADAITQWLTFDWSISPADKVQSITIGGETKSDTKGRCTMLSSPGHGFHIQVQTISGHDEWTFKAFNAINEYDQSMTQEGGPKVSKNSREYIKMV